MPHSVYGWPFAILWLAWLAFWLLAAFNVKAVRRREPILSRVAYTVPLIVGAVLLAVHTLPLPWLNERFLPRSWTAYWIGLIFVAAGCGLSVWARVHLGRNWSGTVTLKEDHELIRSGPYGMVRHPIYTGLILAILGSAIAIGEWRALIAFVVITASLMMKLRIEERFMHDMFGDEYTRYRRDVPALIPRPWRLS